MAVPLVLESAMADGDYSSSDSTRGDMSDPTPDKKRWKDSKSAGALRGAGSSLSSSGQSQISRAGDDAASRTGAVAYGYKRGGKVRKTGRALVHKGERVIPRSKVKKVERLMKRSKMRMKASKRG